MTTDPTRPLTSDNIAAMAADSREIGDENPPMAAMCEHYWASHHAAGALIWVRICQLCRDVDVTDLNREVARYAAGITTEDLRWGATIGRDASRTDREIRVPVCDDDGRELGEMRMGYANARVLMVMLCDAVTDAYEPSTEWVKRKRFDQFDDDQLDDLYDRLEMAEQIIAGYRLRNQPKTWEQQATALATQAKEIGDLPGQIAERIRAEHVCCDIYEQGDRALISAEVPHYECYYAEAAARTALDGDAPKETT